MVISLLAFVHHELLDCSSSEILLGIAVVVSSSFIVEFKLVVTNGGFVVVVVVEVAELFVTPSEGMMIFCVEVGGKLVVGTLFVTLETSI